VDSVDPAGGAHFAEVGDSSLLRAFAFREDHAEDAVLGFADSLKGWGPMLGVHHQRDRLARKERSRGDWQQVDLAGQDVTGSSQRCDGAVGFGLVRTPG
jgi:hypothetical protein